MLQWNEQFETGHALIDTQHKMLISYINQLAGLVHTTNPSRQEAEFVLQLLSFMETYLNVHFRQEEECMESYQCPAGHANKEAHQKFALFFQKFKRQFELEGFRPEVVKELHDTCSRWIQEHIMQIDVQLKPCIARSSGLGQGH